jgi:hypothetical protein
MIYFDEILLRVFPQGFNELFLMRFWMGVLCGYLFQDENKY